MIKTTVANIEGSRDGFFAIDHREWHFFIRLGLNEAFAYLVMAPKTGGDNHTTKWLANAVGEIHPDRAPGRIGDHSCYFTIAATSRITIR